MIGTKREVSTKEIKGFKKDTRKIFYRLIFILNPIYF